MGAEVIEKHITLDRNMKGTDQLGSLGIDGMRRLVRDIRNLDNAIGEEKVYIDESVKTAKVKLERSIATKRDIKIGEKIELNDLHLLSPGDGYQWVDKDKVIGKKVIVDILKDEIIYPSMIK
jgi:sialic acid synthase